MNRYSCCGQSSRVRLAKYSSVKISFVVSCWSPAYQQKARTTIPKKAINMVAVPLANRLPGRARNRSSVARRNGIALRSRYFRLGTHRADARLYLVDDLAQHPSGILDPRSFLLRQRQFDLLASASAANDSRH